MHLRPYQTDITNEVRLWWELGHKVVCVQLSTGGGKTPVLSDLINNHGGFVCAIAHRDRLVEQISLTLAAGGIRHDLICSDKTKRLIAKKHVRKLGQCFYVPGARCRVASIDTLIRAKGIDKWAAQVTLWVVDEAHHLLRANKWGRGLEHFTHPNCHGLMLTATPGRPDKKGLGRHRKGCNGGPCEGCNDGLADALVIGPPMRWLIDEGYLCDYDVVCPPTDLIAAEAPRGSDGDLTRDQVREAERASHIVGDIPSHYLEWANGLSGVTFVGSIETATDVVRSFRERGVAAELITGDTDPTVRDHIFEKAERGEILQIVAVDVISEGVDCLDSETQILTPEGWKGFSDINPGDVCYSLNTATGGMEITPIEAARERPARPDEKVWTVHSQHTNIRVTEGHVIHHQNKHPQKTGGRGGVWVARTAREVHDRQQPFAIPLAAEGVFPGLPLSLDEMHFLGWFLSDGYLSANRATMTLSQSKPEGIAQIKALLSRLGWDYSTRTRRMFSGFGTGRPSVEFRIPKGGRGGSLARNGWGRLQPFALPDKSIPKSFFDMTREQFSHLWKGLMEGDGSNSGGNRSGSLTCGRQDHMEAFTHLAITRGFAAGYGTYRSASGTEIFNIRVRDSKWMMLQPKDPRGAKFDMRLADPDERFWCVKNRNGTIVTRRHGKIAILGNCPALQVGSFGRLTLSPIVWLQQLGRLLRPIYAPGFDLSTRMGRLAAIAASKKPKALLIDHIGGFINPSLGPPDKPRSWSLESGESRQTAADPDDIPNRVCLNPDPLPDGRRCFAPYPRTMRRCPKCGWHPEPASRAAPEHVDGDLQLMDPDALNVLRGLSVTVGMDRTAHDAQQLAKGARPEWLGRHWRNYEATSAAQIELRDAMDRWAGRLHAAGRADYEIQRMHYLQFGIDVISAQGLNAADATALKLRIDGSVNRP